MNIIEYLTNPLVFQYKEILSEEIPFSKAVVDMCKANQCGKYGTCWTCPPGAGELEEIEAKIKSYKNALVFSCKYDLEDCFDFEGMTAGHHETRKVLDEIIQKLKKDNISFLALGCEGCNLCEKCTYPNSPCRFPDKAIVSVEACGINVVELAKKIGINYNNGPQTVTYFCIILF
ncbi:MAG: DUF2284 domain-containing protein [Ruminococcaceae bacterium]|nr:DUF2284 domain-containing protein [Oscillospiraceae bacterium]